MTPEWLNLLGIAVFAVSGALTAGRRNLDWLGVLIIAFVTALGGGTVRDLLLGRQPMIWLRDPDYLGVIAIAAGLTIAYVRFRRPPGISLVIADALGLALFTIGGAQIAEETLASPIGVVFLATVTGTAGGLIRDVLCAEVPMLLRQGEFYATAAIAGASAYLVLKAVDVDHHTSALAGMAVVAGLRMAAVYWQLRLPVFSLRDDRDNSATQDKS